ncbi:MAG TPA: hypothetical protein DDY68_03050 [Porphyromonadaceae bacterium]|nr:hypothetical protein [Porphyromonadaceae bacterium]
MEIEQEMFSGSVGGSSKEQESIARGFSMMSKFFANDDLRREVAELRESLMPLMKLVPFLEGLSRGVGMCRDNRVVIDSSRDYSKDLMTIDQLSDYIKLSRATIYSLSCKKKIPYTKVGNKLLFKKRDIDRWIDERNVRSEEEIESEAETYCATHKM